jgi:enamine deaminase RidA (YjgF/YER057c/UK114 family)
MNRHFNPSTSFPPQAVYSHGVEVPPGARFLYVAGQVGMDADGKTPEDFESEADNAFANVVRVLTDAGMAPTDIVKLNTYMTRPEDIAAVGKVRAKHFGDHAPASTLIYVAGLAAPNWHIEVEAVAAKAG